MNSENDNIQKSILFPYINNKKNQELNSENSIYDTIKKIKCSAKPYRRTERYMHYELKTQLKNIWKVKLMQTSQVQWIRSKYDHGVNTTLKWSRVNPIPNKIPTVCLEETDTS